MVQQDHDDAGYGRDPIDYVGGLGGQDDPFLSHQGNVARGVGGGEAFPLLQQPPGDHCDLDYNALQQNRDFEDMDQIQQPNKEPKHRRQGNAEIVIVLMLLPWLLFTLVVCLFACSLEEFGLLVWVLVGICALLSCLFIAIGVVGQKPRMLSLGLLCIAAVAIGVAIGTFVVEEYMEELWHLESGATYTNLDPAASALSHIDGAVFEFEAGSFVDGFRTVGRMQEGDVYCVAPISGPAYTSNIQYWATGINCCGERRGFTCGDADARPESGDLPDVRSAVALGRDAKEFAAAAKMASAVYGMQAVDHAVFVRWVRSPRDYRDGLWTNATTLIFTASGLHLVASALAALLVSKALAKAR